MNVTPSPDAQRAHAALAQRLAANEAAVSHVGAVNDRPAGYHAGCSCGFGRWFDSHEAAITEMAAHLLRNGGRVAGSVATCGESGGCRLPIAHMGGHRSDADYRPNVQGEAAR